MSELHELLTRRAPWDAEQSMSRRDSLWMTAIGRRWIGKVNLRMGGAELRSSQSAMSSSCSAVRDASYSY
jgi:hypothetical protein